MPAEPRENPPTGATVQHSCPMCGHENPSTASNCGACGERLEQPGKLKRLQLDDLSAWFGVFATVVMLGMCLGTWMSYRYWPQGVIDADLTVAMWVRDLSVGAPRLIIAAMVIIGLSWISRYQRRRGQILATIGISLGIFNLACGCILLCIAVAMQHQIEESRKLQPPPVSILPMEQE